ncbi:MAG TPA: pyrroline-5-carboxylate reductase [Clostridia bacterium]|nr:pyrroline-5-carboxylate reductase [Clostridia bacterium]
MKAKFSLGVIGAGNMATAIVKGAISSKILSANEIIISDVDNIKLAEFGKLGLSTTLDNKYLASNCDTVLFAVKPQSASAIMEDIKDSIVAQTVISIMAGVPISKLSSVLGVRDYVRVMPNTPALIGKGMSALAYSSGKNDFAKQLFSSIGEVVELDENLFDAVTSVSGSGPAYVYLFLKAMIDGGLIGGLPYDVSKKLAIQTAIGACGMLSSSNKPIDELIDAVCSKGGTTIEAINSFKSDELERIVKNGIAKCKKRSEELSKGK